MSIGICPRCNQRYMFEMHTKDFEHQCSSANVAIDEDDVLVVGNWEDFTGSGEQPKGQVMMQGAGNTLQGTRAGIEGEDLEDLSPRGASKELFRQRKHREFIKL